MTTESGAITDYTTLNGDSASNVVGNEQWADAEGNSGPNPDVWGDPNRAPGAHVDFASLRPEPTPGDINAETGLKGPGPDEWGYEARRARGALRYEAEVAVSEFVPIDDVVVDDIEG